MDQNHNFLINKKTPFGKMLFIYLLLWHALKDVIFVMACLER